MYTFSEMRISAVSPRLWACIAVLLSCAALFVFPQVARAQAEPANHLLIYAIDVEGGQSTLLVDTSTGASLLVDTATQA